MNRSLIPGQGESSRNCFLMRLVSVHPGDDEDDGHAPTESPGKVRRFGLNRIKRGNREICYFHQFFLEQLVDRRCRWIICKR